MIKLTKWKKFGKRYIGFRQRRVYIFEDFVGSTRLDIGERKEGIIDKWLLTCTFLEWQEMTRVLTMWEG